MKTPAKIILAALVFSVFSTLVMAGAVEPAKKPDKQAGAEKTAKPPSKEEIARRKILFKNIDTANDKKISLEEYKAARAAAVRKMTMNAKDLVDKGQYLLFVCGPDPKAGKGKLKKKYDTCVFVNSKLFETADFDKNGKICSEDVDALSVKEFQELDINRSGYIEPDEFYNSCFLPEFPEYKPGKPVLIRGKSGSTPSEGPKPPQKTFF